MTDSPDRADRKRSSRSGIQPPAWELVVFYILLVLGCFGVILLLPEYRGEAFIGLVVARALLSGASMSMAMTAFALEVDAVAVLAGMGGVAAVVAAGMIPALVRILKIPVSLALKET